MENIPFTKTIHLILPGRPFLNHRRSLLWASYGELNHQGLVLAIGYSKKLENPTTFCRSSKSLR
jgi:hypothetical protein